MDNKGQMNIAAVAIAALVFLIVLVVYGQITAALPINTSYFSAAVVNLTTLIPLVLVGAVIIGIIVAAFRMAG